MLTMLFIVPLSSIASEEVFLKAQAAYDDGRYAEAALLYTTLLDEGISNAEVHYNLANACFKDRDLPTAVWHYRKAWYEMPRDPDIRANLHFALNAAGAIESAPGFIERCLSAISLSEWILLAIAGYILLTVLLLAALLLKPARRNLLKLGLLPATILLIAAAGWRNWHQMRENPEGVVVRTEATALFGPVEGSTAHFKIPLAALVRQSNTDSKGWIEVEYDGKQGWLKSEYISRLSP
ncbi:MAG: hypothetical protein V3V05_00435 [Pontiella sp.]